MRYLIAVLGGLGLGLFLYRFNTVREIDGDLIVRPSQLAALVMESLTIFAAIEWFLHWRYEPPSPYLSGFERYFFFGVFALGSLTAHFATAYTAVNEERFVVYEPIQSWVFRSQYRWEEIRAMKVGEDYKRRPELEFALHGEKGAHSIKINAMVSPAIPRIMEIAVKRGVASF